MRHLLCVLALAFAGCHAGINYVRDTAEVVNQEGFDGKIVYTLAFKAERGVAADWHLLTKKIHLHPDWLWQPIMFLKGIIAHEMIHAYFDQPCPGDEAVDDEDLAELVDTQTKHGYQFWVKRREVAEKLGIPKWAIPTGRTDTRLHFYWTMQYLDGVIKSALMRVHGQNGFVVVPR